MENRALAAELYAFLKRNGALGHYGDIPAEECIGELENDLSGIRMVKEIMKDIEEIADSFEDHEAYVNEVKPLLRGLREIQECLEAGQSRRMVADTGYEVKQAIHIGGREILIAENMNEPEGRFYMKAGYTENGIIGQYDQIIYSPSYLAVMEEFIGSVGRQITALRQELPDYEPAPIDAGKCCPHAHGEDINGKVVAIKASALRPEYRRADVQMVWVTGGNGARGNARGSAVFCRHLNDGEQTRFERCDVLGVVKELPEWARERLAAVKQQIETERTKMRKDREVR